MSAKTPQEKENNLVLSYLALRRAVGFLGISLPIILIIGAILFGACKGFQNSISDYHNTNMRDIFVGILCAIAFFLFAYKGYDIYDKIAATAAGVFGFMVAIFPTGLDSNPCTIFPNENIPSWFETVHFTCAILFFLVLAYFSIFLFTKSSKTKEEQTPQKKKRNVIYRVCGFIIIGCLIFLALYFKIPSLKTALSPYSPVLIFEVIALWAFGFSWIVKGEAILKDK
jgi:magnesium-transporting ATPase (P-type)